MTMRRLILVGVDSNNNTHSCNRFVWFADLFVCALKENMEKEKTLLLEHRLELDKLIDKLRSLEDSLRLETAPIVEDNTKSVLESALTFFESNFEPPKSVERQQVLELMKSAQTTSFDLKKEVP